MKIIRIKLDQKEKDELKKIQKVSSDYRSERALAVLHCANGKKLTWIAKAIDRSYNTVRSWVQDYIKYGIEGLSRSFSPGRPKDLREHLAERIEHYFQHSPCDFGWGEGIWNVKVIIAQYEKETGHNLGESTVFRCLSELGYSYKRAKKTVPKQAPGKEEKLKRLQEITRELAQIQSQSEVEIFFLDESHFTTDPYIAQGWHKRGVPFFPGDAKNSKVDHNIWGIRYKGRYILLEERSYRQQR